MMDIREQEEFRPIPQYEERYEISNQGRVWDVQKQRYLTKALTYNGYARVALKAKNGKTKYERVARLVALTFIPNPEGKPQVDHINRIKTDDYVENLRWVTSQENQRNRCNNRKVKQINIETGEVIAVYESVAEANEALGRPVNHSGIWQVLRGTYRTSAGFYWEGVN